MTAPSRHVILLDRASSEEHEAVHALIKEHARGWWHHFEDVWIVGGKSAKEWRDLVKAALTPGPSGVLVLTLPPQGSRNWAYYGPDAEKRLEWIHKNY